MGLWDSVKDWFTKYDMEEEKKKYASATEKLNKVLADKEREAKRKREEALERELADSLPDLPAAELKPVPEIDGEELEKSVKDKYEPELNEKIEELDKVYGGKIEDNRERAEDYADKLKDKAEAYKSDTEAQKERFKNKAIDNGIFKSSIVGGKNEELDEGFKAKAGDLRKDYEAKNRAIAKEINALENEKSSKAAEIDSAYGEKIGKEIDRLTKEYEKNKAAIERENLNAEKALTAAKAAREKLANEIRAKNSAAYEKLLEDEKIYGIKDEERSRDYDERLKLAKEFYAQFPPKVAKELAYSNDALYDLLGANYGKLRDFLNELG